MDECNGAFALAETQTITQQLRSLSADQYLQIISSIFAKLLNFLARLKVLDEYTEQLLSNLKPSFETLTEEEPSEEKDNLVPFLFFSFAWFACLFVYFLLLIHRTLSTWFPTNLMSCFIQFLIFAIYAARN